MNKKREKELIENEKLPNMVGVGWKGVNIKK